MFDHLWISPSEQDTQYRHLCRCCWCDSLQDSKESSLSIVCLGWQLLNPTIDSGLNVCWQHYTQPHSYLPFRAFWAFETLMHISEYTDAPKGDQWSSTMPDCCLPEGYEPVKGNPGLSLDFESLFDVHSRSWITLVLSNPSDLLWITTIDFWASFLCRLSPGIEIRVSLVSEWPQVSAAKSKNPRRCSQRCHVLFWTPAAHQQRQKVFVSPGQGTSPRVACFQDCGPLLRKFQIIVGPQNSESLFRIRSKRGRKLSQASYLTSSASAASSPRADMRASQVQCIAWHRHVSQHCMFWYTVCFRAQKRDRAMLWKKLLPSKRASAEKVGVTVQWDRIHKLLPFNCTASEIHFRLAVDSGMSAEDGKKMLISES